MAELWLPTADMEVSKALFKRQNFLTVVECVDRLSKGDDWFTRKNIARLSPEHCGGNPGGELRPLVDVGVLHEQLYDRFEYRYFLLGGPIWDGLKLIAGLE